MAHYPNQNIYVQPLIYNFGQVQAQDQTFSLPPLSQHGHPVPIIFNHHPHLLPPPGFFPIAPPILSGPAVTIHPSFPVTETVYPPNGLIESVTGPPFILPHEAASPEKESPSIVSRSNSLSPVSKFLHECKNTKSNKPTRQRSRSKTVSIGSSDSSSRSPSPRHNRETSASQTKKSLSPKKKDNVKSLSRNSPTKKRSRSKSSHDSPTKCSRSSHDSPCVQEMCRKWGCTEMCKKASERKRRRISSRAEKADRNEISSTTQGRRKSKGSRRPNSRTERENQSRDDLESISSLSLSDSSCSRPTDKHPSSFSSVGSKTISTEKDPTSSLSNIISHSTMTKVHSRKCSREASADSNAETLGKAADKDPNPTKETPDGGCHGRDDENAEDAQTKIKQGDSCMQSTRVESRKQDAVIVTDAESKREERAEEVIRPVKSGSPVVQNHQDTVKDSGTDKTAAVSSDGKAGEDRRNVDENYDSRKERYRLRTKALREVQKNLTSNNLAWSRITNIVEKQNNYIRKELYTPDVKLGIARNQMLCPMVKWRHLYISAVEVDRSRPLQWKQDLFNAIKSEEDELDELDIKDAFPVDSSNCIVKMTSRGYEIALASEKVFPIQRLELSSLCVTWMSSDSSEEELLWTNELLRQFRILGALCVVLQNRDSTKMIDAHQFGPIAPIIKLASPFPDSLRQVILVTFICPEVVELLFSLMVDIKFMGHSLRWHRVCATAKYTDIKPTNLPLLVKLADDFPKTVDLKKPGDAIDFDSFVGPGLHMRNLLENQRGKNLSIKIEKEVEREVPAVSTTSKHHNHLPLVKLQEEDVEISSEVRNTIIRMLKDEVPYVYAKAWNVDAKNSIAYLIAKKDNSLSTNLALSDYFSKFGDLLWWTPLQIVDTKAALAFRFKDGQLHEKIIRSKHVIDNCEIQLIPLGENDQLISSAT